MKKGKTVALVCTVLMVFAPSAFASVQLPSQRPVQGTWLNPSGIVAVRTGDCAGQLCGWVSWASPGALQDAKDSGIDRLIGTELLENYRAVGPQTWKGTVFVPDMGHRFSSTITQLGGTELKISGCVLGGMLCKSQTWHRSA